MSSSRASERHGGRGSPSRAMPRWLLHTLLTMVLWGVWGVVSKPVSTELSAWQVQSLSTLGLLPVLGWLTARPPLRAGSNRRRGFWLAFGAGVITSVGNVACYHALAVGGRAAAVMPLTSLYPVVTIVLALVFLRERLNAVQGAGIAASLGALWCFNVATDAGWLTPWLVVALAPIGLWGLSALLQKLATRHASAELATLAFLLGFLPVALFTPLFTPFRWGLPGDTWLLLLLLGLAFGLGNLTCILAYGAGGRASVVTPMASLYSLVTLPLAVLLLGERPGPREMLGIGLALAAVVALSWEGTGDSAADSEIDLKRAGPGAAREAKASPAPGTEGARPIRTL
jgi:drug/metabolite transporter (DMT)-like permease